MKNVVEMVYPFPIVQVVPISKDILRNFSLKSWNPWAFLLAMFDKSVMRKANKCYLYDAFSLTSIY